MRHYDNVKLVQRRLIMGILGQYGESIACRRYRDLVVAFAYDISYQTVPSRK